VINFLTFDFGPYDRASLAPNQQAWADQTTSILDQAFAAGHADFIYWSNGGQSPNGVIDTMFFFSQLTEMPDAIWPASGGAGLMAGGDGPLAGGGFASGLSLGVNAGGDGDGTTCVVCGGGDPGPTMAAPEPATWMLLALGFLFFAAFRWANQAGRPFAPEKF
jgi:hypothetical protein